MTALEHPGQFLAILLAVGGTGASLPVASAQTVSRSAAAASTGSTQAVPGTASPIFSRGGVQLPEFRDRYSGLVRKLEDGETNINYLQFREGFIESDQFKVAAMRTTDLRALEKSLYELIDASKYDELVDVAKKILSIDYTNMRAHKILQQTYKIKGKRAEQKKHHDIEFGLLNSIVKTGDGKTCETAWPVIQVSEEYFILEMLGAKLLKQNIVFTHSTCDKLQVSTDDGKGEYFFDISRVLKGYRNLGIQ